MRTLIIASGIFLFFCACGICRGADIVAFFQGHCRENFCQHRCQNITNGFICQCLDGYKLNSDGFTCSDEPEESSVELGDGIRKIHLVRYPVFENSHSQTSSQSSFSQDHDKPNQVSYGADKIKATSNEKTQASNRKKYLSNNRVLPKHSGELRIDVKHSKPNKSKNDIKQFTAKTNSSVEARNLSSEVLSLYLPVGNSRRKSPEFARLCDDVVCKNNGTCAVYGTTARCDCPMGYTGGSCQNYYEVKFPKFNGTGYLAFPVLRSAYKEFTSYIEFRPDAKDGLLLFSSEYPSAKGDFLSLSLVNGHVELSFDCGTGLATIRSTGVVTLGKWNVIQVTRVDNRGTLQLNNEKPVEGMSLGAYSRITFRQDLFLGGYKDVLSIRNRTNSAHGFIGCIQQLIINEYEYDMRKKGLVGDALYGINTGECSEKVCEKVVCENGGRCTALAADAPVCLCPLGIGGSNCEIVQKVHIPHFQGYSYLQFKGLGRSSLLYTEIELVFKPMDVDGLLLYNGFETNRKGDFISLALRNGHLEFRFDLGTGPGIIRSIMPLKLYHWHTAKISRTGLQGVLEVDGQPRVEGRAAGAYTQLSLLQDLFVGGHRNYDETSKHLKMDTSFDGCIQKIVVNNKHLNLLDDAIHGVNIDPCEHPCEGQPCKNDGECVPENDIYTCYCPLGYENTNCDQKIEEPIKIPRFDTSSFLVYTNKRMVRRLIGDKNDIQLWIKAKRKDGVMLWTSQDQISPSSDYLSLGFHSGSLQFRYNLGCGEAVIQYNNTKLFNGKWHYVRAQRDKQDGYLEVDGKEIVEGSSPGQCSVLNTNRVIYLGGASQVSQTTGKHFTSGFTGCIKNFVLATDFTVKLLEHAQSGRNIHRCR